MRPRRSARRRTASSASSQLNPAAARRRAWPIQVKAADRRPAPAHRRAGSQGIPSPAAVGISGTPGRRARACRARTTIAPSSRRAATGTFRTGRAAATLPPLLHRSAAITADRARRITATCITRRGREPGPSCAATGRSRRDRAARCRASRHGNRLARSSGVRAGDLFPCVTVGRRLAGTAIGAGSFTARIPGTAAGDSHGDRAGGGHSGLIG